ncbi:hypothetical protein FNV43_RR21704 [Rhamnella rubrinervis]|uniref:Uncharacterized protein n=1 Tax=Rhamnella rubrinervis TaxID=2594499 RepID=A0A8K0GQD4_9ROSA|nr:hypothetical protein FNV43_RR21704 [Rhamnella rubrinervis]
MRQLFSLLSDWIRGRRNPLVEELVPVRAMTPVRESSTGSLRRISRRGIVTTMYRDISDAESATMSSERSHTTLDASGFGGSPRSRGSRGDPKEMPRFPRNVHPEPKSSSGDATSRLVEAIERLVTQNVQQQQPRQQQPPAGINAVVKQFRDLHPPEFDRSMNPLVAENWIRELEKIFLQTDV